MRELFFLFLIAAPILIYWAGSEQQLRQGATEAPLDVSLRDLEKGVVPANRHLRIDAHVALYSQAMYVYWSKSHDRDNDPPASARISSAFIPIVTPDHPYVQQLQAWQADESPATAGEPSLNKFAVLVNTRRYGTVADMPLGQAPISTVQGMLIDTKDSLSFEVRLLLKKKFPQLNLRKVLVIEEGRQPASQAKIIGLYVAGWGMVLFDVGVLLAAMVRRIRPARRLVGTGGPPSIGAIHAITTPPPMSTPTPPPLPQTHRTPPPFS